MFFAENANSDIVLTESEVNLFINAIIEDCFNDDSNYSILEGANIDIAKKFRTFKKEFKGEIRAAKKASKYNNKAEAKKHLNNAMKLIDKIKKDIENMDSTIGSTVLGNLANGIINLSYFLVPAGLAIVGIKLAPRAVMGAIAGKFNIEDEINDEYMDEAAILEQDDEYDYDSSDDRWDDDDESEHHKAAGIVLAAAGIAAIAASAKVFIKTLKELVRASDEFRKDGGKVTSENVFNGYRTKLLAQIETMRRYVDKLHKQIK